MWLPRQQETQPSYAIYMKHSGWVDPRITALRVCVYLHLEVDVGLNVSLLFLLQNENLFEIIEEH